MQKKKVSFHHNNILRQRSMKLMLKLDELCFELLPHPLYSPDFPFSLFADMKKMPQGKKFVLIEELTQIIWHKGHRKRALKKIILMNEMESLKKNCFSYPDRRLIEWCINDLKTINEESYFIISDFFNIR